jgi:hypothetical protein
MSEYGYIPESPAQSPFNNKGIFTPKDIYDLDSADKWTPQLGQLELIQTQTVGSAVAGIDFTNLGDYKIHFITTQSFSSASDYGALSLRVSNDGGSSFISSGSYNYANQYNNQAANGTQNATTETSITQMTPPNSGAAPYASNGYAYLYNFLDSAKYSFVHWGSAAVISANGHYEGYSGIGVYPVAEVHNAFRLFPQNASNADSGTISFYGIKEY